jgi:hypothetical protein
MRGYISFVLVFVAAGILLSSYSVLLPAYSPDLSRAVSVERAYGLQMNIKEAALESIRQGTLEGFRTYDESHSLENCLNCPGACAPPPSPNPCDAMLCAQCFRENEARASAVLGATTLLGKLQAHSFDSAFSVTINPPELEVFLQADPLSNNGFSVDHSRLRSVLGISVESELDISAQSELPAGMVIE